MLSGRATESFSSGVSHCFTLGARRSPTRLSPTEANISEKNHDPIQVTGVKPILRSDDDEDVYRSKQEM